MSVGPLPSVRDVAALSQVGPQGAHLERAQQSAALQARRVASDQSADAAARVEDLNDEISVGDDSGGDGRLSWQAPPHSESQPGDARGQNNQAESPEDARGQNVDFTA